MPFNVILLGAKGLKERLEAVKYSSRYALGMYFDTSSQVPVRWGFKFLYDHPIWRYASWDHVKRNRGYNVTM